MKIKFYTLLSFTALAIFLASCKSATKLYQKGNYDEAVQVAVKKLQKDPSDSKLRSVVQDAYHYAVDDHENRIRSYAENANELKWEWTYNEYADLQNLYNAIYRAPSVYELVHPTDYSSYLNTYSEKAAQVRYDRGMQWMDDGNKESFKKAYHEFQAALSLKPGDITIRHALDESYDAALTKVMVMPVDDYGYTFSSNSYELKNMNADIIRSLQYNTGNEFVKFYSSWEAQRDNVIPDQVVELRFSSFDIGQIHDNKNTKEISKQVVVKETVYKPDSVIKQWATVTARIITTTRTMYSEGNLNISIRDNSGHWLWNDNIHADQSWSTSFTTFSGDERALSEEDKKLLNQKQEDAPRSSDIITCIKENISNDLLYRLKNYYNR
jgi:hypothetical protein